MYPAVKFGLPRHFERGGIVVRHGIAPGTLGQLDQLKAKTGDYRFMWFEGRVEVELSAVQLEIDPGIPRPDALNSLRASGIFRYTEELKGRLGSGQSDGLTCLESEFLPVRGNAHLRRTVTPIRPRAAAAPRNPKA